MMKGFLILMMTIIVSTNTYGSDRGTHPVEKHAEGNE